MPKSLYLRKREERIIEEPRVTDRYFCLLVLETIIALQDYRLLIFY